MQVPPAPSPDPIDVIIPCFRGLVQTRRALESALSAKVSTPFHLVVVDDACPDPDLRAFIASFAHRNPGITLLRHAENQGFVRSINEAMAVHPERDAVLLNSDATVFDGWLDRLVATAERHDQVASVTPLSNNATIASYPVPAANNAMTLAMAADVNRAAGLANPGESTEIPVAIGFCMFIRRFAWQLVGPFDAERYGRGYGEEVDWCMRAVALGLAHRLALDTFVHHEGETSFGADGARLREVAQADIDARYPDFNARVQRYLADRPAEAAYRRIDLQRLATRELPKIVVVTHAWGGGVERHVRDLIALLENDVEVLVLRPHGDAHLKLEWARSGEALALYFAVPDDLPELATVLAAAGVSRLHFHHLHGSPQALLTLPERLGLPYDVTLHDYAMLSPTYHLCDLAGVYRDDWRDLAPPPPSRSGEVRWPLDPQAWRALFAPWLSAAERVIAPTHDVARRFELAYPGLVVQVWPHPEATLARPARRIKVLLLGGLSRMKGEAVLAEVTQFVAAHDLGLDFILLGHTSQPLATWPAVPLHVRGSYPDDTHLLALIEQERADVVWFPAQVPETYSFTLSVAMASGLSIVASDLGAFPERLRGYARAWLVPWTSNASAWVGALRRAAQSAGGAARVGP